MSKRRPATEAQRAAAQEKQAAFKTLALQLSGEIKEGKHTERLARVAREQPEGLGRYSLLNQLLILAQCPHATETHGFTGWQQLGYQVRKGAHGIAIRAPHERKSSAAPTDGEEESAGSIGFHRVYVFDRSQVDPISLVEASPANALAIEYAKKIAELDPGQEEEEEERIRAEEAEPAEEAAPQEAEPATV